MRKFLWPALLVLAGCALPPREEVPPPTPTPAPTAPTPVPQATAPGEAWKVVGSRLEVRVYRDGKMQKLGHNHVITSDDVQGEIEKREPLTATSFELTVPLESLVVDDDAARAAAGAEFPGAVPQKDRDATRQNMLGEKLLDAAQHPRMRLASESISGEPGHYQARVRVSLAGGEHVVTAPFTVSVQGGEMKAHAAFSLTHEDLGLVPLAVAAGLVKVRDEFEVELTLAARRGS